MGDTSVATLIWPTRLETKTNKQLLDLMVIFSGS